MPRISSHPLERRGRDIILYSGEWEELREIVAAINRTRSSNITVSGFIRELVHVSIKRYKERANRDRSDELDIELALTPESQGNA